MKTLKFIISSNAEFTIAQGTREEAEEKYKYKELKLKKRLLDHELVLDEIGQGNLWLDDTKPIADQVINTMTEFLKESQITMEIDKKTNMIDSLLHDLYLLLSCKGDDCWLEIE